MISDIPILEHTAMFARTLFALGSERVIPYNIVRSLNKKFSKEIEYFFIYKLVSLILNNNS